MNVRMIAPCLVVGSLLFGGATLADSLILRRPVASVTTAQGPVSHENLDGEDDEPSVLGELWAWGHGGSGQLGNGDTTTHLLPVEVRNEDDSAPLAGVTQVATAWARTCVRLTNGIARCWGNNGNGQLGDGTNQARSLPVEVRNSDNSGQLENVVSVSMGSATCAATEGGTARCWGLNSSGEIGDGTTTTRLLPVNVRNSNDSGALSGVEAISAGGNYACAKMAGGTAFCWGNNGQGRLGDGTTSTRLLPVEVRNESNSGPLSGIAEISTGPASLGSAHTCARLTNGTARCWGSNQYGRLGDGTTTNRSLPVAVRNENNSDLLVGIAQISVGENQTCARMNDGTARCWGSNYAGALGDGTTTDRWLPVEVRNEDNSGPLTGITQISVGYGYTCAAISDGTARCWGWNNGGLLGDGTETDRYLPVVVRNHDDSGPLPVVHIVAGREHTVAMR